VPDKPHVRWRLVAVHGDWMCWEVFRTDGKWFWPRIIVTDPKSKRGRRGKPLDDRVLSMLELLPKERIRRVG
jgi:hypothetical protein